MLIAAKALIEAGGVQTATDPDFVLIAHQLQGISLPPHSEAAFLTALLRTMHETVQPLREVWHGGEPQGSAGMTGGARPGLPSHTSRSFYRVWSALEFLLCTSHWADGGLDNARLYGEGIVLGATALLRLLGQEDAARLSSFNGRVLAIHAADAARDVPSTDGNAVEAANTPLARYVRRAEALTTSGEKARAMIEAACAWHE